MGDEMPAAQTLTVNMEEDADKMEKRTVTSVEIPIPTKPLHSPGLPITPMPYQRPASLDIDDYFSGPRDIQKHSKWPLMMRLHGSVLPRMILPLCIVGGWASAVVVVSQVVDSVDLSVNSVLLTILGFVVGLGLSFRSSTAYERYSEGRRYWASTILASHTLGRVFWIHAKNAPKQSVRESMLRKVSAMNMVVAFAVALKHALRFEPFTSYHDLHHLVGHLNTFAKEASDESTHAPAKKNFFKEMGVYLGVSFAESNPRKAIKKSQAPLGNLPLEILNHLAIEVDNMVTREQLTIPMQQTLAYNHLAILNDCLNGCERVLTTPLPIAYTIAISQITWVYVCLLPFQLIAPLGWIAIPATVVAAYIILGLLFIGQEIENPFGNDVNDLPLESYCNQIAHDMDVIAAYDKTRADVMLSENNMPLYPVSTAPMSTWMARSEEKLQEALRTKPVTTFQWRRTREPTMNGKSADHMA